MFEKYWKIPRGWYNFKKLNLREILEQLEAKHEGEKLSRSDKDFIFLMSNISALREGLLEVEARLNKLERNE